VLDLAQAARARDGIRRDALLAVTLLRRDLSQSRRVLAAGNGSCAMLSDAGDTIRYGLGIQTAGALERRVNAAAPQIVAAAVDTASFALRTVARPYTLEQVGPVSQETLAAKFEPGDWDEWVARTSCNYELRAERKIGDSRWSAEEFWPIENYDVLTRAALRVKARDMFPTQADLLILVYEAAADGAGYPSRLLAQGRISRLSVTRVYSWIEIPLVSASPSPIVAGGHYWVVFRHDGAGGGTYAGHVEVERLKDCTAEDLPDNRMIHRQSDNAGSTWDNPLHRRETFFRLFGRRTADTLVDLTPTLTDTLGVDYRLALRSNGEREYRAGFVALHNL
jgi:hypothetical protein